MVDGWAARNQRQAVVSARSKHPGGVHVNFMDGHASFVGDSVDLAVWRALATADGNETNTAY